MELIKHQIKQNQTKTKANQTLQNQISSLQQQSENVHYNITHLKQISCKLKGQTKERVREKIIVLVNKLTTIDNKIACLAKGKK